MRQRSAWVVSVLAVLIAVAPAAQADVTVLGLRSLDGDETVAEKVSQYLRSFLGSRGLATVTDQTQTLEQMLLLGDCGDDVDARCLREIADMLAVEEVLYGFVTRMPGEDDRFTYNIDLRRFRASARRDVESANGTLEPNRQGTASLQILANTLLDALWGQTTPTSLIVQSNEPNAEVFVDGESVGRTGAEPLWVAGIGAGEHEIRILKEGFDPWERTLEVEENQYRLLEAPLNEIAVAVATPPVENPDVPVVGLPDDGDEPAVDEGPSAAEIYFQDWRNIAGWSLVAGGLIFGGVGVGMTATVSGYNDDSQFAEYRRNTPSNQDVCDRAAADPDAAYVSDICDSADTYEIVQFVMYGLAVAALGTGAYFLIDAGLDDEEQSEASASLGFTPIGLPGGGGLGMVGTF